MKRHTVFGIVGLISGTMLGSLLVGVPLGLHLLKTAHHYFEHEIFFKGQLGHNEVRGVSYFDYHGIGFMESNQWKVEIRRPNDPDATTVYTSKPIFQESLPHRPEISIVGDLVRINDGEQTLIIQITDSEQSGPDNPVPSGTLPIDAGGSPDSRGI